MTGVGLRTPLDLTCRRLQRAAAFWITPRTRWNYLRSHDSHVRNSALLNGASHLFLLLVKEATFFSRLCFESRFCWHPSNKRRAWRQSRMSATRVRGGRLFRVRKMLKMYFGRKTCLSVEILDHNVGLSSVTQRGTDPTRENVWL